MVLQNLGEVLEVVEEEKQDTLLETMSARHCWVESRVCQVGGALKVDVA